MNTAGSILGVYNPGIPKDDVVHVHTPDPSRYHDPSTIRLGTPGDNAMAAMTTRGFGYSGWRGVVIPHASELGGSLGHNPHNPADEVFIDPELNNKSIVVNMRQLRSSQHDLARASRDARAQCADPRDAAVVTYGQFSQIGHHANSSQVTVKQAEAPPFVERREAPLQMPGTYVVPKASPGGGQIRPVVQPVVPAGEYRAASFSAPPPPPPPPPPTPPEPTVSYSQEPPPPQHTAAESVRSLHALFDNQEAKPVAETFRPLRSAIFELPQLGEFQVKYHDVVRQGMTLVLVHDKRRLLQMVWFPPIMEDAGGSPKPLALWVGSDGREPEMAYLVHPTGLRFTYEGLEFCLLTIEREVQVPKGAVP